MNMVRPKLCGVPAIKGQTFTKEMIMFLNAGVKASCAVREN